MAPRGLPAPAVSFSADEVVTDRRKNFQMAPQAVHACVVLRHALFVPDQKLGMLVQDPGLPALDRRGFAQDLADVVQVAA